MFDPFVGPLQNDLTHARVRLDMIKIIFCLRQDDLKQDG